MTMRERLEMKWIALGALVLAGFGLSCSSSSSDSGGMSGTGISQGSINSFGSIFVNGVEWDVSDARIELDGVVANESALRVGMVVRVEGDRSDDGLSGDAQSVEFDDSIEGPIQSDPVETVPGLEKTFSVLGTTIVMRVDQTSFDDGASFAGLVMDDVVEVSGFVDAAGAVHATRIERKGAFPVDDEVELRGNVANLVKNMDGSGIFDLGTITVRYDATTSFDDVTRTISRGRRPRRGRGQRPDQRRRDRRHEDRAGVVGTRLRGQRRCEGRGHRGPLRRVAGLLRQRRSRRRFRGDLRAARLRAGARRPGRVRGKAGRRAC